jgi:hypothetical protein
VSQELGNTRLIVLSTVQRSARDAGSESACHGYAIPLAARPQDAAPAGASQRRLTSEQRRGTAHAKAEGATQTQSRFRDTEQAE